MAEEFAKLGTRVHADLAAAFKDSCARFGATERVGVEVGLWLLAHLEPTEWVLAKTAMDRRSMIRVGIEVLDGSGSSAHARPDDLRSRVGEQARARHKSPG